MRVTKIAETNLIPTACPEGPPFSTDEWLPLGDENDHYYEGEQADWLAEFAGRACYQAWHRPNDKTAHNKDYLANILRQGHESVLEHASVTFYIEGVSRSLTHELIRHRHLSFSELSQRYVDVGNNSFVMPPAIGSTDENSRAEVRSVIDAATYAYANLVTWLSIVLPRKQAREAARAVMPNATETKIVVTGNLRAWRDVLKKRYSTHADAEIRELATEILRQLRDYAPGVFQDFPDAPFGTEE